MYVKLDRQDKSTLKTLKIRENYVENPYILAAI